MKHTWSLGLLGVTLFGCGADQPTDAVSGLIFTMFAPSSYNTEPLDSAWTAANTHPELGLTYTFPIDTTGIAQGTEIRLTAGRSSAAPSGPLTTGDDVIIQDEQWLATTQVEEDGTAAFAPLVVVSDGWQANQNQLPAALLCDLTVIAARAYEHGDGNAYRWLGTTWVTENTPPCP